MASTKPLLLYITPLCAKFVEKDIEFLEENYDVKVFSRGWEHNALIPFRLLQQLFFLLRYFFFAKATFVMFGGFWSVLPSLFGQLFGRRVFLILGGTDAVNFPFLNYGSLRIPLLAQCIYWSARWSTKLLPVHESLIFSPYQYHPESEFDHQGIKFFYPDLTTEVQPVYNGFDPDFFQESLSKKKGNTFIIVTIVNSMRRFRLKGGDLAFTLARKFPEATFTIIGMQPEIEAQLEDVPRNVTLFPFLDKTEFLDYLRSSQYYLQLSISEGFPNALCEAMLCNCIPIGSSVGAIPFIIGETGIILEKYDPQILVKKVSALMSKTVGERQDLARAARQRIADNFHINERKRQFIELIEAP